MVAFRFGVARLILDGGLGGMSESERRKAWSLGVESQADTRGWRLVPPELVFLPPSSNHSPGVDGVGIGICPWLVLFGFVFCIRLVVKSRYGSRCLFEVWRLTIC